MRPITMLLWSQWRQTGWCAVGTVAVSAACTYVAAQRDGHHGRDMESIAHLVLIMGAMFTMGLLVFMHGNKKNIRLGYPAHLKLLPLKPRTIAFIELLYSAVLLTAMFMTTWFLNTSLMDKSSAPGFLLAAAPSSLPYWIAALFLLYAIVWTLGAINLTGSIAIAASCVALYFYWAEPLPLLVAFTVVFPLVAVAGAVLGRSGRLASLDIPLRWPAISLKPMRSLPTAAVSWFEARQDNGWATFLYVASWIPAFALQWIQVGHASNWDRSIACAADALLFYAFLIGARSVATNLSRLFAQQSALSFLQPLSVNTLARARLLTFARRMAVPLLIFAVIWTLGSLHIAPQPRLLLDSVELHYNLSPLRLSFMGGAMGLIDPTWRGAPGLQSAVAAQGLWPILCMVALVWLAGQIGLLLVGLYTIIGLATVIAGESGELAVIAHSMAIAAGLLVSIWIRLRSDRQWPRFLLAAALLWTASFLFAYVSRSTGSVGLNIYIVSIWYATLMTLPLSLNHNIVHWQRHRA